MNTKINNTQNSLSRYLIQISKDYKIYFLSLFIVSLIASFFEILVHYKIKEIIDEIAVNQNANLVTLIGLFVFYKLMHHGMFFIERLLNIKYKPEFCTRVIIDIYQKNDSTFTPLV